MHSCFNLHDRRPHDHDEQPHDDSHAQRWQHPDSCTPGSDRDPGRIQFRVPNGQYTKLHLLAAFTGEADTTPLVDRARALSHRSWTVTLTREQLRSALGTGDIVVSSDTNDSVDITVILGADAVGLPTTQSVAGATAGGSSSTSSNGGTGG